jgi:peptide deformylase
MQTEMTQQEVRMAAELDIEVKKPYAPKQLPLRYWPDSVLSEPCIPVAEINEGIRHLAMDMLLTMMKSGGIGLAAPQVGQRLRIFVADVNYFKGHKQSRPYVFINPAIVPLGANEVDGPEGCLSFPNTSVTMKRAEQVIVRATDMDGNQFELDAVGLMARVVQHENDHLNGVTINPHLGRYARNELRKGLKQVARRR